MDYVKPMRHHSATGSTRPAKGRGSTLVILALTGWLSAAPAHGLTEIPRSFDELVQLADVVMVGTVKEVRSELDNSGFAQNIFSLVSFNELRVIKGQVAAAEYTLRVPGGVVGRFAQDYPGVPVFHTGQRYVVFVRGNNRDFFPVVGITQGVFRVLTDSQGRQVVVRDAIAAQAGLRRSLSSVTDRAPGLDGFLRQIKDRLPAAGGNPP